MKVGIPIVKICKLFQTIRRQCIRLLILLEAAHTYRNLAVPYPMVPTLISYAFPFPSRYWFCNTNSNSQDNVYGAVIVVHINLCSRKECYQLYSLLANILWYSLHRTGLRQGRGVHACRRSDHPLMIYDVSWCNWLPIPYTQVLSSRVYTGDNASGCAETVINDAAAGPRCTCGLSCNLRYSAWWSVKNYIV